MAVKASAGSIDHIQGFFIAVPISDRFCVRLRNFANNRGASSWIYMFGCQMKESVHVCLHSLEAGQLEPEVNVCWSSLHLTLEECQLHGVEGDTTNMDIEGVFRAGLDWAHLFCSILTAAEEVLQ